MFIYIYIYIYARVCVSEREMMFQYIYIGAPTIFCGHFSIRLSEYHRVAKFLQ